MKKKQTKNYVLTKFSNSYKENKENLAYIDAFSPASINGQQIDFRCRKQQ